ncbi:MAG TPA: MBL fold metallo-hydrolase [Gemmatimonadales bacterium]|nr:MBL fold metallo-hydrolase [Gemmatimonadales bacterium]
MIFKRLFDTKLAQASYLIGCPESGEALVIDPNRSVDRYLRAAAEDHLRIAHVTETHIHADFVSGARELAQRTGARLYLSGMGGADWQYDFASEANASLLEDGSRFSVGRVVLDVVHVPGHTPEHLSFLVTDCASAGEPMGALTGDFIFVGDVGRPDLLERAVKVRGSMEDSARQLYRSLQRFRALPDYLQIWPGHGAGSACGKALGAVPQSTLGYEKRYNWAFSVADESAFVSAVLAGQPDPPRYFAEMKRINRSGPRILGQHARPAKLPVDSMAEVLADESPVVDTRAAAAFRRGFLTGTINIPANRSFTTWSGSLLPYDRKLYLIAEDQRIEELVEDLAGVGLDQIEGYWSPDLLEHPEVKPSLQQLPTIAVADLTDGKKNHVVVDVRAEAEWNAGHIPGSVNIPLGELEQRLGELPRDELVVHCQSGGRAAIAASLLRARGFRGVQLFSGGFAEWCRAGQPSSRLRTA